MRIFKPDGWKADRDGRAFGVNVRTRNGKTLRRKHNSDARGRMCPLHPKGFRARSHGIHHGGRYIVS
ncbi:MAG: hypothetical protein HYY49_05550 [Ignavibacteriales bacterium]|nr:hypothetical protein [Ignavibacteriales bacterium]